MTIVFRVDSSLQIGSGHLMRCFTLAEWLYKKQISDIVFICRNLEGNLSYLVEKNNYILKLLPSTKQFMQNLKGYDKWLTVPQIYDADETIKILSVLKPIDYLVVDSYAIDELWEKKIRPYVNKIMVIDDLANRKHDCDILLDQNFYLNKNVRYNGLIPTDCRMLLGPEYALLREEFYQARKKMRTRDGNIRNILVFFGASDLTNETMKTLKALSMGNFENIIVNVITGKTNTHNKEIERYCGQHNNMHYYCQVDNMAEFMNEADLAIGAGGTTTWERCFLGLPAIVIAVAENQVKVCEDCAQLNYIIYLGKYNLIDEYDIFLEIIKLIKTGISQYSCKWEHDI